MATIRAFGSLSKVARNHRLERLSASAARVVPATISLVMGRVVCGEDCSGKLGMASDLGPKRGAWAIERVPTLHLARLPASRGPGGCRSGIGYSTLVEVVS